MKGIMTASLLPGPLLALASAVLFGASTPLAMLLVADLDPWMLAGLLYLGAGLGLSVVLGARRLAGTPPDEAPLRRADLPWLAAVVLAGGVAAPVLLMAGLAATGAAAAALLLNLEGVFTLVIAWVVFRENVDRRVATGAAAILLGAGLLSWPGTGADGWSGSGWGAAAVAAACLAWAIDNNLTRRISGADPWRIALAKGLFAGPANVALALVQGAAPPAAGLAAAAMAIGFFGYGVSVVLFVLALRRLGTARTGAYFAVAPFVGAAVAVTWLGEPVTVPLAAAGVLMAVGVGLHLTERHDHPHVHEPMRHEHSHVHDEHHRHAHSPGDPPGEPHSHVHSHERLVHRHPHYPDIHHRHSH